MLKRIAIAFLSVPALASIAGGIVHNETFGVGFGLAILGALAVWGVTR